MVKIKQQKLFKFFIGFTSAIILSFKKLNKNVDFNILFFIFVDLIEV